MAHYAKVVDGLVVKVIVAEESFFNSFVDDSPGSWIQTSYNTHGNIHSLGGTPLRKNFAGVGQSYDLALDAFIPRQKWESWTLNTTSGLWESPVPYPETGYHKWDEPTLAWIEIV